MTFVWFSLCVVLLSLAAVVVLVRRGRSMQNQLTQYRGLVERLPDGVILVGADGLILQQNIAAAQLLDSADSVLVGSALCSWLPQLSETQLKRQPPSPVSVATNSWSFWKVCQFLPPTGVISRICPVDLLPERRPRSGQIIRKSQDLTVLIFLRATVPG